MTPAIVPDISRQDPQAAAGSTVNKISRKVFLLGGATVVATAATGACLCTKTGWATISGVGATPSIAPDAYVIEKDKSIRICLDKVPGLALVGGTVKIVDAKINDSLIVVRESEDVYVAASIKCTHRGVEVEYRADYKCFQCASLGGSRFKTSGEKVSGFANGPLKTYPSSRMDNILVIRLA
jgi:Rieske Fe-S protein